MPTNEETILIKALADQRSMQDLKNVLSTAAAEFPRTVASEFQRVLVNSSMIQTAGMTFGGTVAQVAIKSATEKAATTAGAYAGKSAQEAADKILPGSGAAAGLLADQAAQLAVRKFVASTAGIGLEAQQRTQDRIAAQAEALAFEGVAFSDEEIQAARDALMPRETAAVAAGVRVRNLTGGLVNTAEAIWAGSMAGLFRNTDPMNTLSRNQTGSE